MGVFKSTENLLEDAVLLEEFKLLVQQHKFLCPKKIVFLFCACHQEIAVTSLLQTRETEAREPWGNMPVAVYSCITCHLFLLLSQAEQARKGPHSGMELGHVLGRQLPWPLQSLGPVEIPNLL